MTQNYDQDYWHAEETRSIPWPGKGSRSMTMERIHWGCYDALLTEYEMEAVTIAKICVESAMHHGAPIDDAFPHIVANMERELKEIRRPLREVEDRFGKNVASKRIGPFVYKDELERVEAHIAALEACRTPTDDSK